MRLKISLSEAEQRLRRKRQPRTFQLTKPSAVPDCATAELSGRVSHHPGTKATKTRHFLQPKGWEAAFFGKIRASGPLAK